METVYSTDSEEHLSFPHQTNLLVTVNKNVPQWTTTGSTVACLEIVVEIGWITILVAATLPLPSCSWLANNRKRADRIEGKIETLCMIRNQDGQ